MAGGKKKRRPISKTELAMRHPVWAADKHAPLSADKQTEIVLEARMAFHRILQSEAKDDDPSTIGNASNVAMILCEWHAEGRFEHLQWDLGGPYLPRVQEAQQALLRAEVRFREGKSYNFTGSERAAIEDLLMLFEQQLDIASHVEVMRAIAEAADRIRAGQGLKVVVNAAADAGRLLG